MIAFVHTLNRHIYNYFINKIPIYKEIVQFRYDESVYCAKDYEIKELKK